MFTGAALFGIFSLFAVGLTEDGLCRRCSDLLTRLMQDCPMGRHGGCLDSIVAIFIVAVVAVMVLMGLLMAPYFIYRLVTHISRVGLRALETYVLDIGDADPALAADVVDTNFNTTGIREPINRDGVETLGEDL